MPDATPVPRPPETTVIRIMMIGNTSETAAIASSPRRLTKYVWRMFDTAAMNITAVVGAARVTIARSGRSASRAAAGWCSDTAARQALEGSVGVASGS